MMEKWEEEKVGGYKRFYFLSFLFGWEWKNGGIGIRKIEGWKK